MSETASKPRPDQLWRQAHGEFLHDQAARRIRYIALMREHGHLRPTLPTDPQPPRTVRQFFGCDAPTEDHR